MNRSIRASRIPLVITAVVLLAGAFVFAVFERPGTISSTELPRLVYRPSAAVSRPATQAAGHPRVATLPAARRRPAPAVRTGQSGQGSASPPKASGSESTRGTSSSRSSDQAKERNRSSQASEHSRPSEASADEHSGQGGDVEVVSPPITERGGGD